MKLFLLFITLFLPAVAPVGYPLTEKPFPVCTNNSTACDGNFNYPYCVQCSDTLALCSATAEGCGCEVPDNQVRWDNKGKYLDHNEEYMTRAHCAPDPYGGPDKRVRSLSVCKNSQLVMMRENSAACPAPNTTCIDSEDTTGIGGPTCVPGSGSISIFFVSRASIVLIVTFSSILLLC